MLFLDPMLGVWAVQGQVCKNRFTYVEITQPDKAILLGLLIMTLSFCFLKEEAAKLMVWKAGTILE